MMTNKQIKQAVFTIIALVICVVGYIVTDNYASSQREKTEQESIKKDEESKVDILKFDDVSKISEISYDLDEEKVVLKKNQKGNWIDANDKSIKLDSEKISSKILEALKCVSGEIIADESDSKEYGFDEPLKTISVIDENETEKTIIIGSRNEFDSTKCYLMINGDSNIYVVDSTIVDTFSDQVETYEEETTTEAES